MSCIVLDIDLADENLIKELRVSIEGKVQGYSFRPPKNTKQAFCCTRNLCNDGRLHYNEF